VSTPTRGRAERPLKDCLLPCLPPLSLPGHARSVAHYDRNSIHYRQPARHLAHCFACHARLLAFVRAPVAPTNAGPLARPADTRLGSRSAEGRSRVCRA